VCGVLCVSVGGYEDMPRVLASGRRRVRVRVGAARAAGVGYPVRMSGWMSGCVSAWVSGCGGGIGAGVRDRPAWCLAWSVLPVSGGAGCRGRAGTLPRLVRLLAVRLVVRPWVRRCRFRSGGSVLAGPAAGASIARRAYDLRGE